MCRVIKTLYNFASLATDDEIRAASLQSVRKISGCNKPSQLHTMEQVTLNQRERS